MQIDIIKEFLKDQDWQFTQVKDKNILLFGIGGKNGNFQCIADLIHEENRLIFFSVCGANTPESKRNDMLQLLNALNYKLFFGNFEMDLENGEIRYRTSVSFKHIELNQNFIEEFIMSNIVTMDKSLPSLVGVMFGEISAEKALELSNQEE
jgi:hypothetical protein